MTDNSDVRRLIHDLNNILTRILTTAELIETQGEPDDQLAVDARAIRDAALEGRDVAEALRAQALASEDAPAETDGSSASAARTGGYRPDGG